MKTSDPIETIAAGKRERLDQVDDATQVVLGRRHGRPDHIYEAYLLETYPTGCYTVIKPIKPKDQPTIRRGGGKRGQISEFPRQAQRHLHVQLSKISDEVIRTALFLTLTYPDCHPAAGDSKRHLDLFLRRLKRAYPHICVYWKLEYQARLAPHYHLLLLGVQTVDVPRLQKAWFGIVASGDAKHLAKGVKMRKRRFQDDRADRIRLYLMKSPGSIPTDHRGRFWGKVGDVTPYLSERLVRVISRRQYVELDRTIRQAKRAKARRDPNPRRRARRISWLKRGGPWSETVSYIGRIRIEDILSSVESGDIDPSVRVTPRNCPYQPHPFVRHCAATTPPSLTKGTYSDDFVRNMAGVDDGGGAAVAKPVAAAPPGPTAYRNILASWHHILAERYTPGFRGGGSRRLLPLALPAHLAPRPQPSSSKA